ncbi:MAG: hypothetical protein ABSG86_21540 [Thermoguttaceae bacterium]|jgi:hypothetical protein
MLRNVFLVIAAVLFVVALILANVSFPSPGNPNGCAGASAGFAVAGGLALVAAALVKPDAGNGG